MHIHTFTHVTRHENFHGKFSLCAEYLSRSIGQKLKCKLKVFTDYPEGHILGKQLDLTVIVLHIKSKVGIKVGQ